MRRELSQIPREQLSQVKVHVVDFLSSDKQFAAPRLSEAFHARLEGEVMGFLRERRLGIDGMTEEEKCAWVAEHGPKATAYLAECSRRAEEHRANVLQRQQDELKSAVVIDPVPLRTEQQPMPEASIAGPCSAAFASLAEQSGDREVDASIEAITSSAEGHKRTIGHMMLNVPVTGPSLATVVTSVCLVALILAGWAWATRITTYEDCVLRYVKAGMSEYAASVLEDACTAKYPKEKPQVTLKPIDYDPFASDDSNPVVHTGMFDDLIPSENRPARPIERTD